MPPCDPNLTGFAQRAEQLANALKNNPPLFTLECQELPTDVASLQAQLQAALDRITQLEQNAFLLLE